MTKGIEAEVENVTTRFEDTDTIVIPRRMTKLSVR